MEKKGCMAQNSWAITATYFQLAAAATLVPPPRYQEGSISALRDDSSGGGGGCEDDANKEQITWLSFHTTTRRIELYSKYSKVMYSTSEHNRHCIACHCVVLHYTVPVPRPVGPRAQLLRALTVF